MRDDGVQAKGDFTQAKGSKLAHTKLIEFIERNYACDQFGRWYFQNGPQCVFVELQSTPFVWRVQDNGQLTTMRAQALELLESLIDENGRLYALTDKGIGLIHSLDTWHAAKALEDKLWAAPNEVLRQRPAAEALQHETLCILTSTARYRCTYICTYMHAYMQSRMVAWLPY
jgi:hypothetical protein